MKEKKKKKKEKQPKITDLVLLLLGLHTTVTGNPLKGSDEAPAKPIAKKSNLIQYFLLSKASTHLGGYMSIFNVARHSGSLAGLQRREKLLGCVGSYP